VIGRKGIGPGTPQQKVYIRQDMARTRPLDQELHKIAHGVAKKEEQERQERDHSALATSPYNERQP